LKTIIEYCTSYHFDQATPIESIVKVEAPVWLLFSITKKLLKSAKSTLNDNYLLFILFKLINDK